MLDSSIVVSIIHFLSMTGLKLDLLMGRVACIHYFLKLVILFKIHCGIYFYSFLIYAFLIQTLGGSFESSGLDIYMEWLAGSSTHPFGLVNLPPFFSSRFWIGSVCVYYCNHGKEENENMMMTMSTTPSLSC